MNTGLGDAMNLGWKLAATIKGWAPDDLLDTYTTERHPIGEWVLNWTRAQVSIVRPDPHARAMAAVIRDLIEVYEKSISANSPKIVTFNTLAKGVAESWAARSTTGRDSMPL